MKIFVYKTLFVLMGLYVLYVFTIGNKISSYEHNLKKLANDQGRDEIRMKIMAELKKATERDKILDDEDRKIIKKFISKIQGELND